MGTEEKKETDKLTNRRGEKRKNREKEEKNKRREVWFICLNAYQLSMGYLILKLVNVQFLS